MSITVHTYVEVDLEEIDDDDLVDELESRGYECSKIDRPMDADTLQMLYYALYFGKTERALEIARTIAQDSTGKVLP